MLRNFRIPKISRRAEARWADAEDGDPADRVERDRRSDDLKQARHERDLDAQTGCLPDGLQDGLAVGIVRDQKDTVDVELTHDGFQVRERARPAPSRPLPPIALDASLVLEREEPHHVEARNRIGAERAGEQVPSRGGADDQHPFEGRGEGGDLARTGAEKRQGEAGRRRRAASETPRRERACRAATAAASGPARSARRLRPCVPGPSPGHASGRNRIPLSSGSTGISA